MHIIKMFYVEDLDVNNDGRRADLRLHNLGENGEAVAVDIVVPDPFAVSRMDRCLRETGHHLGRCLTALTS